MLHFLVANPWALGALVSFLSAFGTDLHSYSESAEGAKFSVTKSLARCVSAGIGGGLAGAGLSAVAG